MTENAFTQDPTLTILLMLGIFMIAGCAMESTPNIVIPGPVMLPLAPSMGMNHVHFCIFMVTSLGIGFISPPLGLNLFVISGLTDQPAERNGQGIQRAEIPCGKRGQRLASGPDPLVALPQDQR